MSDRVHIETVDGRPMLVTDLRDLGSSEAIEVLQSARLLILQQPKDGKLLSLVLVHRLKLQKDLVDKWLEAGKASAPWMRATAFAGVSEVGRLVLRGSATATGRKIGSFETEEEARQWLVAQAAE